VPCLCYRRGHQVTAIADLLKPADCQRLLEHLAEADELDRLMRERGTLASPGEPEPLHCAGRGKEER
jgi:hypothetical protein